jgi:hypothetical protein
MTGRNTATIRQGNSKNIGKGIERHTLRKEQQQGRKERKQEQNKEKKQVKPTAQP